MFYFLCEGEECKAEYSFILYVINEFRSYELYELIGAGSKDKLDSKFNELMQRFKAGDVFILFFDNVEMIKGRPVPYMLAEMNAMCKSKGVIFRHTTYYCFEELFLSYAGLVDMLSPKDNNCKEELQSLQESLMAGDNYWLNRDLNFWVSMFPALESATTREQFSARLLTQLTNRMRGNFRITKSTMGLCWAVCCDELRESRKIGMDKCTTCRYNCKNCSFRRKLEMLDKNSVSSLSVPFSTIFWNIEK